jgi:hypothetical protein
MIGLLDGDIVVFRCGFAAERNVWHLAWDPKTDENGMHEGFNESKTFEYKREAMDHLDKILPGKFSRVEGEDYSLWAARELEPLSHALQGVKKNVEFICAQCDLNPDFDLKIFFSKGNTFRHRIAVTRPYKGNRKVEHRPTYEDEIRKYMMEKWDCEVAEDQEADDLLAINQTKYGPEESIIISLDKDLDQVPGLKYNWLHDIHYSIDEKKADYNLCMQILTGDSTDNIPGIPGMGPGKAAKALHGMEDSYQHMMEEVARQYQIKSGKEDWYEYMVEQARLVYIRRQPDEMWEPPALSEDTSWNLTEEELTL